MKSYEKSLIGGKQIAICHIAKAQLGLSEKEYRAALLKVGATTSKQLTFRRYYALLRRFQADGFTPTYGRVYNAPPKTSLDRQEMLAKIGTQLGHMNLTWNYANAIAKHMFKVDRVRWCLPEQLHAVIAALEYKRRKQTGEEPSESEKRMLNRASKAIKRRGKAQ